MAEPIDPEFASVTLAAVAACRTFALEPPRDLGYVSRLEIPEYKVNASGWPATIEGSSGSSKKDGPWNWGLLFGPSKGPLVKFDPTDVVELQAVIDFVRSRPDLAARLSISGTISLDVIRKEELLNFDAIHWVTSLIQRAEAIGATTRDDLLSLYCELEYGLLSQSVRGDLLLPIALVNFELDTRLEIAPGIAIEPLDEATQRARAPWRVGSDSVNPYLAAAATHAVVIEDQEFSNDRGPQFRHYLWAVQPIDTTDAERVFQAIQILSGTRVGYAQICLRPRGWADGWKHDLPPLERLQTVNRYPVELADGGWNKAQPTVPSIAIAKLPEAYAALSETHRRAQLAARRLFQSSLRELDDDIVIDACIGIEALLGEQHDELVHRMALRAATALAADWSPAAAYDTLKKVYAYRSKIVHGGETKGSAIKVGKVPSDYRASEVAVYILEQLLRNLVTAATPWTPDSLDADVFAAITLGAQNSNAKPVDDETRD